MDQGGQANVPQPPNAPVVPQAPNPPPNPNAPQPPTAPPLDPAAAAAQRDAALVRLIAGAVAQAIRPLIPAPPAPKTDAKPPDVFDGSHDKFKSWTRQVETYLIAKGIREPQARIFTTLTYMRGGTAEAWAQRYIDDINNQAADWDIFTGLLGAAFQDRNLSRKAREELEVFSQDSKTIDDYFTQLESKFSQAGMADDVEKICILEKGVKPAIIDAIYGAGNVPILYDTYKDRVQRIGRLGEQRQSQKKLNGFCTAATPTPNSKFNPFRPQQHAMTPAHIPAPPVVPVRTGTGITYTGAGQPMDIGKMRSVNKCFQCGQVGHFRRDCPQKQKFNVRALRQEFDDEEWEELCALMNESTPTLESAVVDESQDFLDD